VLFALAAPPSNVYPALWLGMAALAWTLHEDGGGKRWLRRALDGGARGLLFGAAANAVALRFVPTVIVRFTPLPWAAAGLALLLLALFEGLRWATASVVCRACARAGVPRWAAFPIGVFAGTFVMTVFPWSAAGGVTPWPAMVQLADIVGERGVTALMALSAALLAEAARTRTWKPLAAGVALPLATLVYGALRIRAVDAQAAAAPHVPVALVEPNIGATDRWDPRNAAGILAVLTGLTARAEAQGASLVVWPESAYPYVVAHASRVGPMGDKAILGPGVHGPVLTGIILRGGADETYNSAVVAFRDGTISEAQDKLELLWFGETVPFADRVAWIRQTFSRGVGLSPGKRVILQSVGPVRAAVLNCFEDTLPGAGRTAMRGPDGLPNLLVNVTNDAWFAGSAESELHLRLAALRAVEQRRDLVRAVNWGPTTWVDAAGRVVGRWDPAFPSVLLARPALLEGGPTVYGMLGDWPLALLMAAGVGFARWRSTKRKTGAATEATPASQRT
jgi:apolipoprotein N-acyltransferase